MFTCKKNRLQFLHLCTKSWYKQLVPGLSLSCSSFDQFQIGFMPAISQRAALFPVRGMNSSKSDLCLHFVHLHVLLKKHLRLIENKMNGRLPGGLQLFQGQLATRYLKVCI